MKSTVVNLTAIWKRYFACQRFSHYPLWVRIAFFILLLPFHISFVVLYGALSILYFAISMIRIPGDFLRDTLREVISKHWLIQFVVYAIVYPLKFLFDLITAFQYLPLSVLYFLCSLMGFIGSWGGVAFQPFLMYIDTNRVHGASPDQPSKKKAIITGVIAWTTILGVLFAVFILPLMNHLFYNIRIEGMYQDPIEVAAESEYTVKTSRSMNVAIFSFTPAESRVYFLSSSGNYDTKITVEDANRDFIDSDDDGGYQYNFNLPIYLTANQTYFFVVSTVYRGYAAEFDFIVSREQVADGSSFGLAFPITGATSFTVTTSQSRKVYYEFIPQVSGTYTITSTGGLDTTVALYSSTYAQITFDDDTGAGLNFSITRTFSAGTTYYLAFSLYGTSSGSFTVNLSKLN